MHYGITDLAEILGVTTSAIRYFEKEHLIQAEKENNGHRYYNEVDVFRLLSYMKYRSMDIPMKQIITQFSGQENNWKIIMKREEVAKENALVKAEYYRRLAKSIETHIQSISLIDTLLNKYEFEKSPSVIIMQDEGCGWLSRNRQSQQIVHQWVAKMPAVQLVVLKAKEGRPDFGYMVPENNNAKDSLPMELNVYRMKSSLCLHTIVKAEEDFASAPQKVFEASYKYAKDRGFEITGGAWGKILLVEVETGQKLHTYIELWIPVC